MLMRRRHPSRPSTKSWQPHRRSSTPKVSMETPELGRGSTALIPTMFHRRARSARTTWIRRERRCSGRRWRRWWHGGQGSWRARSATAGSSLTRRRLAVSAGGQVGSVASASVGPRVAAADLCQLEHQPGCRRAVRHCPAPAHQSHLPSRQRLAAPFRRRPLGRALRLDRWGSRSRPECRRDSPRFPVCNPFPTARCMRWNRGRRHLHRHLRRWRRRPQRPYRP